MDERIFHNDNYFQRNMSIKVKNGETGKGTRHHIPTFIGGVGVTKPIYQVYHVSGLDVNKPSEETKTVFLAYDGGKSPYTYAPYLCMTLDALASDGEAVTAEDVFWKEEKSYQE